MDAARVGLTEVHLWEADPGLLTDDAARRRCLASLSESERARHDAFVVAGDRQAFCVAHAMLRHVLSGYLQCSPDVLTFVTGQWGRPELPPSPAALRFSLSHTHAMAACAVTARFDCGVDVEDASRVTDVESVAPVVLAPVERAALEALPAERRGERFLALWTLKESVAKALGRGLSYPIETIALDLDALGGEVAPPPNLPGEGEWRLWHWRPTPRHHAALAVRCPERETVSVIRRQWQGPGRASPQLPWPCPDRSRAANDPS